MLRALLLCLLLLAHTHSAAAQGPLPPTRCIGEGGGALSATALLERTVTWPSRLGRDGTLPVEMAARPKTVAAAAGQSIDVDLLPPVSNVTAAALWQTAVFVGAGRRTDAAAAAPDAQTGLRASVIARGTDAASPAITVRLQVPDAHRWQLGSQHWLLAVAACDPATGDMLGQAVTAVSVTSPYWSAIMAAGLIAGFYGVLAFCAFGCNRAKLLRVWQRDHGQVPATDGDDAAAKAARARILADSRFRAWALWRVVDPVFISQDATGSGSLSRLQLLLFSLAVGFVTVNIFAATGAVAALSNDVLWLLGITMVATGLARLVPAASGLSGSSRFWIAQRQLLKAEDQMPTWRDVVAADGEIDVTRVQAIVFTLVTLFALVVTGLGDLSEFALSDQVKFLLGLSQAAYIGGKAVPSDALKQLDSAIKALMAAEEKGDQPGLDAAKPAAASLLTDIYGALFRREMLAALQVRPPSAPIADGEPPPR